jgi:hypothetical protein
LFFAGIAFILIRGGGYLNMIRAFIGKQEDRDNFVVVIEGNCRNKKDPGNSVYSTPML